MKLALGSDLHLEFGERQLTFDPPPEGTDILILAGDIHTGDRGIRWAAQFLDQIEHILYVAGNHEFYGHAWPELEQTMAETAKELGVTYLQNDTVEINGWNFIGSTLWTDYQFGVPDANLGKLRAVGTMNDFRRIRGADPNLFEQSNQESKAYIDQQLKLLGREKTVVITHHAPVSASVHPVWEGDDYNAGFVNGWDEWVANAGPAFWFHGHIHSQMDKQIGATRVAANPRAYGNEHIRYGDPPFAFKEFVI